MLFGVNLIVVGVFEVLFELMLVGCDMGDIEEVLLIFEIIGYIVLDVEEDVTVFKIEFLFKV